jgi:hypothetical protein
MLQLGLQQGSFSVEDRDEIDNSSIVPRPRKSQCSAGVADLILQAHAALLLGPVSNQRVDNFVPKPVHAATADIGVAVADFYPSVKLNGTNVD